MKPGMRVDKELMSLAVEEALSTKDVIKVAKDFDVAPATIYKWISNSKKENLSKDKQDFIEKFLDLIQANYDDLASSLSEHFSEERTEHFLRVCLSGITGFKCYYKERLKGDKDNANKERLKFLKKFCYLLYELED